MARMNVSRRYRAGRQLSVTPLTGDRGWVEGREVLRPGDEIVLFDLPEPLGPGERRACVDSWMVLELGKDGTVYGGVCRWLESPG